MKGSAGIFGLDAVVGFTHHVETLLDRLREGQLLLTPALSTLLLQCNDQIKALVDAAQDPHADDAAAAGQREALIARLHAAGGSNGDAAHPPGPGGASAAEAAAPGVPAVPAGPLGPWLVSARFGPETFRNGMDPLTILRYVAGLGRVDQVACDSAAVPTLELIDPECCHLGLQFTLQTDADRAAIEAAFSFVRDDCALQLTPPAAPAVSAAPRLGEMLVAIGAVTPDELSTALQQQAAARQSSGPVPPIGALLQSATGMRPQIIEAALQTQSQTRQRNAGTGAAPPDDTRHAELAAIQSMGIEGIGVRSPEERIA